MIKSRIYYVSVYFQYVLPIHFILLKHSDTKHILLNISKSKGNRTMKFGQSIEYNMKSIFLENLMQIMVEKLKKSFLEKIKIEHIFGSTVCNFVQFVFTVCASRGLRKYI